MPGLAFGLDLAWFQRIGWHGRMLAGLALRVSLNLGLLI